MSITRRNAIKGIATMATAIGTGSLGALASPAKQSAGLKGNINHSVCRWPFGRFSLEELCFKSVEIGIRAIDLVNPEDFGTLKKYGLDCSMSNGPGTIEVGFNRRENHPALVEGFKRMIPLVAEAGFTNIICFSGNKAGLDDQQGIENCAAGIREFIGLAEQHGVTVFMEVLNSRVDHKDYHANNVPFVAAIADKLGSDNFKILFDIYHMQVDNGDIIRTIRDYSSYIGHYHTAGVPGRNEIDETQELYYPAIMQAIVDTGFDGWVAQEFIPRREPWESLRQAVHICDV